MVQINFVPEIKSCGKFEYVPFVTKDNLPKWKEKHTVRAGAGGMESFQVWISQLSQPLSYLGEFFFSFFCFRN